ncbi:MAG: sigma-70 family RNA polymerase sigma factor [Armatimonadetes bacterium]|nr:sigma-70 family RNA polymerase sigma factor [Armatimonadota bacterium]
MVTQQASAETADHLWSAYASHPTRRLRERLIEQYRPLAYSVLRRIRRRGDEDLEQVALLGLVKAVDHFNPALGNRFSSFAVPTILGELKRYLRDHSRPVRPPRSLLDLHAAVVAKDRELTVRIRRTPAIPELASALSVEPDQVTEALAIEEACHPYSLDGLMESLERDQPVVLEECLGVEDPGLAQIEAQVAWSQAVNELDPPLKEIIELRYYRNLTQREAARRLGVSQMHVSRLERRALDRLRCQVMVA